MNIKGIIQKIRSKDSELSIRRVKQRRIMIIVPEFKMSICFSGHLQMEYVGGEADLRIAMVKQK